MLGLGFCGFWIYGFMCLGFSSKSRKIEFNLGLEQVARGHLLQNIVAHQNTASVSITFTVTFPIITRMKFGTTLQHVVSTR